MGRDLEEDSIITSAIGQQPELLFSFLGTLMGKNLILFTLTDFLELVFIGDRCLSVFHFKIVFEISEQPITVFFYQCANKNCYSIHCFM